jgi:lipopolysaccharide export system protein LptA
MPRFLLSVLVLFALAQPVAAQINPLGNVGGGDQPLELESDKGLELHQDQQMVVARGNVLVRQGDVRLRADIVSASYKDIDGRRSIHRVDALGGVVITTGKERLTGGHATYDLERELFVLKGRNLRIEAEDQTVTAEDSLEYWGAEKRAVARGEATAIQNSDNTRIRADVIEAQLAARGGAAQTASAATSPEKLALNEVRAWGKVVIKTESEVVVGDKGAYDAVQKVATLEGNVTITRGKNQLSGAKAIVDMESGVSRLLAAPGQRVRSVFYPGTADGVQSPAAGGASAPKAAAVNPVGEQPQQKQGETADKAAPVSSREPDAPILPRPRPQQSQ